MKSPAGWAWLISAGLVRKETGKQERSFSTLPSWSKKQRPMKAKDLERTTPFKGTALQSLSEWLSNLQYRNMCKVLPLLQLNFREFKLDVEKIVLQVKLSSKMNRCVTFIKCSSFSVSLCSQIYCMENRDMRDTVSIFFPLDIMDPTKHHKVKGLLCGKNT